MSKKSLSVALVLIFICPTLMAQDFSFQKPALASSTPSSSYSNPYANVVPARQSPLSPQGFANSTDSAYSNQQAKVNQMATQKLKEQEANSAKDTANKQQPGAGQKPAGMSKELPTSGGAQPQDNQRLAPEPVTKEESTSSVDSQAYTGFQSTPPPSSTPSNSEQKSGGWGSGIKY